jgi:DNA repair exonuclease SbcCD ATPase subunit
MRLLRIQLDGFGQFNQGLTVNLDPSRINLVVGRNEAGKSTLLNAISGILFGFRDLNVMRRYEPWGEHAAYSGELEFLAGDGRRIRIARDFRAGTATIVAVGQNEHRTLFGGSADPRGSTGDDRRYFDLIGELLGIEDEGVFRNTVFVGQMSLTTSVSDQIRRLLSGSSSIDYKGALHELHGRYSDLTGENPWRSRTPARKRMLDHARDDLAAAEKGLEEGRDRLVRFIALEGEVQELECRRADHGAAIKALESNLDVAEKLADLQAKRGEAAARVEQARRRHESYASHQQETRMIEERVRGDYAHFRNAPESFQEDASAWVATCAEKERETALLGTDKKRLETAQPVPNRLLGAVLGLLLLGGSVAAGAWSPFGLVPGAIVGAVLGLAGLVTGTNLGTGFRAQKEELARRVAERERTVRACDKRLDGLDAASRRLLVGADAPALLASYREFVALVESRKRHLAAMRAIGDANSVSVALAEAVQDQGQLETAAERILMECPWLSNLGDPVRLGAEITRLKADLASQLSLRDAEREQLEKLRLEIAGVVPRMDFDLPRLAESARDQRTHVRDLALDKDAMKEAIDTLDACIKDFQESDVFRLSDEMSHLFSRITDGKYTRVHLGPSLEPLVATEGRVGIRPEELSAGAHDQLYFAMRIAMVRHLSRNIRLPIFLDDPFVNFDAERLEVTREVLKNLPEHQVVLVTCDRGYEQWSSAVVDLDKARRS